MENKKNSIMAGIGWAFSERFLAQSVSLIVSIVLARLLDPDHYGIVALVTVIINLMDAFVSGGFGNALIQKKDADDLDFDTILWWSICISTILYLGLYMLAPTIESFYEMDGLNLVIRVMGVRIIISAYNSIQHAYIQKKMEFRKFFFSTLIGTIVSAFLGITLAYLGFGVWALVIQYMSNSIIDSIVLAFTINWKIQFRFNTDRFKSMFNFGMKMIGATFINTLQDNIRTLIIGKTFTVSDLAYYNQGKKYPALLMDNVVVSIQKVLFPAFAIEQENTYLLKVRIKKAIRLSSLLFVPAIIGLIACADNFIYGFLTNKWGEAIMYLRILSLVYLTRAMNSIFQSSLLAVGKSGANMFHEIVGSIISIVSIILGAFVFKSVSFIAWSYVANMIVGTFIFAYFVNAHYDYSFLEIGRDFIPFVFISCIMGLTVFLVGKLISHPLLALLIQVITGIGLYSLLAYVLFKNDVLTCWSALRSIVGDSKKGRNKI